MRGGRSENHNFQQMSIADGSCMHLENNNLKNAFAFYDEENRIIFFTLTTCLTSQFYTKLSHDI